MPFNPQIRAKPTKYKSIRFRSKTEVLWAKFFDKHKIEWEYEKKWFKLNCGYYLPDFYLKDYKLWVEVKPPSYTEFELKKCDMLSKKRKNEVVCILNGIPNIDRAYIFIKNRVIFKQSLRALIYGV